MKPIINVSFGFLLMALGITSLAQEYQQHFSKEEFRQRRENVYDAIGNQAIVIVQGASDPGGFVYPRQSNTFYYLCGVENSGSYLLMDGRNRRCTLYLEPSRSKGFEQVLSLEDIGKVLDMTGVDTVMPAEKLKIPRVQEIYTMFSPAEGQGQSRWELQSRNQKIANDPWDGRSSREHHFISLLQTRFPRSKISDLTPIMDHLRSIKSPAEIELLRKAGELSALGINEAMKITVPSVYEYQLDAAARFVFLWNGARLEGYRSITASGVHNISDGHYYFNSSPLKAGDLVLMDYAPDYGYYTSDIGRMWPVNGTFNDWQKELYRYILEYHKIILALIRPGTEVESILEEASQQMEPLFDHYGFSKPHYETAVRHMVETGGGAFSHTVGMAVHDVGSYRQGPLQPGQVFAVDPQLRVREENLYMRIEDTVVITEDGVEVLTSDAPIEIEDIERLILETGLTEKQKK